MPTYLDMLGDDLFIKIYKLANEETLKSAATKGNQWRLKRRCKKSQRTNEYVCYCWGIGKPMQTKNLITDGRLLCSYDLTIATTEIDGTKTLYDYTSMGMGFYSMTTSRHVNQAKRFLLEQDRLLC